jgi:hypothetical protein
MKSKKAITKHTNYCETREKIYIRSFVFSVVVRVFRVTCCLIRTE